MYTCEWVTSKNDESTTEAHTIVQKKERKKKSEKNVERVMTIRYELAGID